MDVVDLTQDLLRIPSTIAHADGESRVAESLRAPLDAAGLTTEILVSPSGRPSLVARLPGPTDRPALVLLSHTDVVDAEEAAWRHDPFGGEIVDGELWGRGALDMKGVAALHVAALVALASDGREPVREVILVAAADEESGGAEGTRWLLDDHPARVGLREDAPPPEVLGEGGFGLAGLLDRPLMPVALGEKSPLGVRATATGDAGHGSMPPRRQAVRELARFIEAVAGHRPARVHPLLRELFATLADLAGGPRGRLFGLLAGSRRDVAARALAPLVRARAGVIGQLLSDTLTPTTVRAGSAFNVVPGTAEATLDCRLLPGTDPDEILDWLARRGEAFGVTVEEVHRWQSPASTPGPLYELLVEASSALDGRPVTVPSLTPGMTDLRFFRSRGAAGYGWVPLVLDLELLSGVHGHDERVPVTELQQARAAMTEVVVRACT